MKYFAIACCFLGLILVSSYRKNKSDESEAMKQALLNYFDGIKNHDTLKMSRATTDDIRIYEEGNVWTNDSVFAQMRRLHYSVNFKFDHFKIDVDDMLGHMSYFEEADFIFNDTSKHNLYYLGSAACKKEKDGWKLCFLHSDKHKI